MQLSTQEIKLPVGGVSMGDLRRTSAISSNWGLDRGTPIDRRYISNFIDENIRFIKGRILEVKEAPYACRGGAAVGAVDIVDIDTQNSNATIYADLTSAENIDSNTYDCVILTQTICVIYDVASVIKVVHRILKPGGTVLLTVPGPFSPPFPGDTFETFYWAFYPRTIASLLSPFFSESEIEIRSHGNLSVCAAFISGLSIQDLSEDDFKVDDPFYPLIITARATKR